ncbi:MAG TPA: cobalt-precorrin-6A reductase [Propionibacteriaceae bacterium]
MSVLILGGTAEARALAAVLVADGVDVVSSLAGRVSRPALPAGRVRVGGFGGVSGLAAYLVAERVDAVIDATHPFAAQISANAAGACAQTSTPLVRLERPGWCEHPGAYGWTWVADLDAAREATPEARRPFLTTGRQSLGAFLSWADRDVLVRVVDPPEVPLPSRWTIVRSRGPYDYAAERRLLEDHRVDALLTKDSGGEHTAAKLAAADDLGIPVVIIERPPRPDVPTVPDVEAALQAYAALPRR